MGDRITWRSQPDIATPLGMYEFPITAADALADNKFGPMPLEAFGELLLRVKKLQVFYSITHSPGTIDEYTNTETYTMDRVVSIDGSYVTVDERSIIRYFAKRASEMWPSRPPFIGTPDVIIFRDPVSGRALTLAPGLTDGFWKDESGASWLDLIGTIAEWGMLEFLTFGGDFPSGYSAIPAALELSAETYSITASINSSVAHTGMVTLTATEWFPYATTTGDPAWDTATGLPINGGPGA